MYVYGPISEVVEQWHDAISRRKKKVSSFISGQQPTVLFLHAAWGVLLCVTRK